MQISRPFVAHPVDTEKWHRQEHFHAHIDDWRDYFFFIKMQEVLYTYPYKNSKILCIKWLQKSSQKKSDLLFVYKNMIIFLQNNFKQNDFISKATRLEP